MLLRLAVLCCSHWHVNDSQEFITMRARVFLVIMGLHLLTSRHILVTRNVISVFFRGEKPKLCLKNLLKLFSSPFPFKNSNFKLPKSSIASFSSSWLCHLILIHITISHFFPTNAPLPSKWRPCLSSSHSLFQHSNHTVCWYLFKRFSRNQLLKCFVWCRCRGAFTRKTWFSACIAIHWPVRNPCWEIMLL